MGREDYPLNEFAHRLANVEERYAREILSIVECFYNSRLDLPAKKLEEIGKCHLKTSRHLKKAVDAKKSEYVNLWKISNIFSVASVDTDNAMRDIRNSIRKRMKKNGSYPAKQESSIRRFMDENNPVKNKNNQDGGPTEIYDVFKPRGLWRDKFSFPELFRDKKEKKQNVVYDVAPTVANMRSLPPYRNLYEQRPSSLYSSCSSSASSEEAKPQAVPEVVKPPLPAKPVIEDTVYPVAPVRTSKMKNNESAPPPNATMNWITSDNIKKTFNGNQNDKTAYPCYESFYSDDKNIIHVSDERPRMQTRINIGDPLSGSMNGIYAQTHSIQITQDKSLN